MNKPTFAPKPQEAPSLAPQPATPAVPQDRRDHWEKVFLDQSYFDAIAKQPGIVEGAKVSMFGEDYAYRAAMIGYLSDSRQVPLEDMRTIYDAEKDSVAQKEFGKPTISSREFFDLTRKRFETSKAKAEAGRGILEGVVRRALVDAMTGGNNDHYADTAADLAAQGELFDSEDRLRLQDKADEMDLQIRSVTAKYGEDARWIFTALSEATGSAQVSGLAGKPDFAALAERFAQLPDEQRTAVYSLAGAFAKLSNAPKGFWQQLGESMVRGADVFTESLPRNLSEEHALALQRHVANSQEILVTDSPAGPVLSGIRPEGTGDTPTKGNDPAAMAAPGMGTFGAGQAAWRTAPNARPATAAEREKIRSDIERRLRVLKVQRELRRVAQTEIDPIAAVTNLPAWMEQGLYGAAGSVPFTATAFVPYVGPVAVYGAMAAQAKDDLIADGAPVEKAGLLAATVALPMTGLEMLKVASLARRMPSLAALAKEMTHPSRSAAVRVAAGLGVTWAEQTAQELAQNALPPIWRMVGSALDEDIPGYDLEKAFAEMPFNLLTTAVATLPLSLLAGGHITVQEIQRGENYLKSLPVLQDAGFAPEQIDRITGAASTREAVAIIKEEFGQRPPEAVEAAARRVVERIQTAGNLPQSEAVPTVTRNADGSYDVTAPGGELLVENADQATAVSAVERHARRWLSDAQSGVAEAVGYFEAVAAAQGRGEDTRQIVVEGAPRTLLDDYEANPTPENLDRLFETVRAFGAVANEPADLALFPVLASNEGTLRDGIWRSAIRINEGASAQEVIRELAQDNLKQAIAEGRVSLDWVRQEMRGILAETERNVEGRTLRADSDTDVVEAFSDLALSYFTGKRKIETIPAGLRGFIIRMGLLVRDIVRRAYKLKRMIAEGRVSRDFEALLAESVGIDRQAFVDQAADTTAREMLAAPGSNYSIRTPAEAARVEAALAKLATEPRERLRIYGRAKDKFDRMTARNAATLAAISAGDFSRVQQTQVLQALGELGGIVSALPVEIRGKIGGTAQIAAIKPVDLYRGDEKLSEAKNESGAIIGAWMREGLNIAEARGKTELPPGYRVVPNQDAARTDRAIADELVKRIGVASEQLEGFLRREYLADIARQLDEARPKVGDNKIATSKLGPEAQRIAGQVYEATLLDGDQTSEQMDAIERKLADASTEPDQHSALLERWGILNAFGDIENRTAAELAQASQWLADTLRAGRNAHRMQEEARRERYKAVTADLTARLKQAGLVQGGEINTADVVRQFIEGHLSFIQLLRAWLPAHPFLKEMEYRISKAEQTKDINTAKRARALLAAVSRGLKASGQESGWLATARALREIVAEPQRINLPVAARMESRRMEIQQAERLIAGDLQPAALGLTPEDVTAAKAALDALTPKQKARRQFIEWETLPESPEGVEAITKDDAMQFILSWDQPDVRERMERQGWTPEIMADLNKLVADPVAQSVLDFLREEFATQHERVNPVYRAMFGMDMPRLPNWAPTRYRHQGNADDLSPLGDTMEASGMTPGSMKRRQNHNAKLRTVGATSVYQQNLAQIEHWLALAEINRDLRGVFMRPDMREAIEATFGLPFLQLLDRQIAALTQGGSIRAQELMADKRLLAGLIGGKSIATLGLSLRTIVNQIDASMRGALHIGLRNFAKAVTDPGFVERIPAAWHSDAVQRRIMAGSNPLVRYVYDAAKMKPSAFLATAQASMLPMQYTDAGLSAFTAAAVFTHHYNAARAAGASEQMAEATATREMEYALFNYSQPIDTANRSVRETQGSMWARAIMLFQSDARLKTALTIEAIKTAPKNPARAASIVATHAIMGLIQQTALNVFLSLTTDDERDEIWTLERYFYAMALGPLTGGFFLANSAVAMGYNWMTGGPSFAPSGNIVVEQYQLAQRAIKNAGDLANLDDPEAMLKEWDTLSRALAVTPAAGALAAVVNLLQTGRGIVNNMAGGEE